RGALLAQDQPQERRLARSRGSHQEDELTALDLQRDVAESRRALPGIGLGDAVESDHGYTTSLLGRCESCPSLGQTIREAAPGAQAASRAVPVCPACRRGAGGRVLRCTPGPGTVEDRGARRGDNA